MKSCVLAYSGGLDTSVLVGWLMDEGFEVHCVYVDVGQPCEDRQAIIDKALKIGAKSARVVDVRDECCRDFAFPMIQWQAKYEGIYLLGTSIARPIIARACLRVAHEVGAKYFVHGATGKGNDQCRFQIAAEALDPEITVIAPWRLKKFRDKFPGRSQMIAYCAEKNIPVKASVSKPYSSDENCFHISYEAGQLEDLNVCGVKLVDFGMGVSPKEAPDQEEEVTIEFVEGNPVAINGEKLSPAEIIRKANEIAGRNGVGRIDMVENRFVGMKSRDLTHLRDRLAPEVAEMIYYGFWYHAKMDALLAFIRQAQKVVTGSVKLLLYKGNIDVAERFSPNSLYDEGIATMEGGGSYNQDDAEGFIRLQSLPGRVQGRRHPWGKD